MGEEGEVTNEMSLPMVQTGLRFAPIEPGVL